MEDQINTSDQNAQRIGQNPASQPIQIPEKPKVNYWMVSTLILGVILLGLSGLYVYKILLDKQSFKDKTNQELTTNKLTETELQKTTSNFVYFTRILGTTYDKFSLWKLNPYTKETSKIIDVESGDYNCNQNFQVDPKGTFTIFCKNFNLYKFTIKTNELKQITQIGNAGDDKFFGVSVSPATISSDGKLLAYEVSSQEFGIYGSEEKRIGNPNVKYGLYVLNLESGETKGPLMNYKGAISGLSGEIYFTESMDRLIVDSAGEDKLKLINLQDYSTAVYTEVDYSNTVSFSLSNDCSIIESYEPFKQGVTKRLYTTDGDLREPEQVYETTDFLRFVRPSPDCKKLVFEGDGRNIYILDVPSKQKQFLINEDERANGGTMKGWLSDSKTVIYINHDNGDIFSLNVDTRDNQRLTNFGDIYRNTVKVY